MRCDVGGASGHVTMKPSICKRSAFYPTGTSVGRKSRVYAVNVSCLTPGGLQGVEGTTDREAISCDRFAEVSRRHSRLYRTAEGLNKLRAVIVREEGLDGICRSA